MKLPSRRRYPRELHIGEETYSVRIVDKIPGHRSDVYGICDPSNHVIYIQGGLTKSQMFRTFIHEVLHALECEHDIKIKHEQIYQLEKAIGDLFLANF